MNKLSILSYPCVQTNFFFCYIKLELFVYFISLNLAPVLASARDSVWKIVRIDCFGCFFFSNLGFLKVNPPHLKAHSWIFASTKLKDNFSSRITSKLRDINPYSSPLVVSVNPFLFFATPNAWLELYACGMINQTRHYARMQLKMLIKLQRHFSMVNRVSGMVDVVVKRASASLVTMYHLVGVITTPESTVAAFYIRKATNNFGNSEVIMTQNSHHFTCAHTPVPPVEKFYITRFNCWDWIAEQFCDNHMAEYELAGSHFAPHSTKMFAKCTDTMFHKTWLK